MIYLNGKKVNFIDFPNKERRLDLPKEMVNMGFYDVVNDVYWKYDGDASIFELLLLDNAIHSYKENYNLYIGYMPYSRMDRTENEGTAFSLNIMTTLLTQNLWAISKVFILDPHSEVTLKQLNRKSKQNLDYNFAKEFEYLDHWFDETTQSYSFAKDVIDYTKLNIKNAWFVFPDKGAAKRYNANDYPNVIVCEKVRDFATGQIQNIKAHIEKQTSTPDEHAPLIIIDDLCSYGGTFVGAVKAIENDLGITSKNNWLIVTHAEEAMTQGNVPKTFQKIFTTDSIATPSKAMSMSSHDFDGNHQFYVRPVLDIIEGLNK